MISFYVEAGYISEKLDFSKYGEKPVEYIDNLLDFF
jgi:hypothetical protein